ncbi:hypothetical protein O4H52_01070 [Sphingomonadaceae bacterium G21617-S1]|nr:hypothetical protein [Sphingomonadaceae bacterium G21617-S1]
MTVKFIEPAQVGTTYNVDEIATFDEETEAKLIEGKVAVDHKLPKPKGEQQPAA